MRLEIVELMSALDFRQMPVRPNDLGFGFSQFYYDHIISARHVSNKSVNFRFYAEHNCSIGQMLLYEKHLQ